MGYVCFGHCFDESVGVFDDMKAIQLKIDSYEQATLKF